MTLRLQQLQVVSESERLLQQLKEWVFQRCHRLLPLLPVQ